MTAIAGIASSRPDLRLDHICATALAAQSLYGAGRAALRQVEYAAFGIDLYPTLPEDKFDRQPICDERFMLVADLRIDNRDELSAQLAHSPRQFIERSDSDVLLLAWQRWGEDCLQHIVGDYAFAVYDRNRRELTLARDPTGSRPLCYSVSKDYFRFASMPSGALPAAELKPSLAALAARLAERPSAGRSCFEEIDSLLPGELLRYSPAGIVRRRYWSPQRSYKYGRGFDQTVEEFRNRLDDSVRPQMRHRSGPLATHLSSGYDSSAVTGTAVKLLGPDDRLVAFTSAPSSGLDQLNFRGRISDESAIAAGTAEELGIEHVIIRDGSPLLGAMPGHARFYQEPVRNIFNQGWWIKIAETAATKGAEVLLTGAIGNFTLSHGTLPVLSYWLRTGHWIKWVREGRAAISHNEVRWRGVLMASLGPWLPEPLVNVIQRQFLGAAPQTLFARTKWLGNLPKSVSATGDPFTDRLNMIRAHDFGHHRKGQLAQTGIDERDPTSDRRLIEFCLNMPPHQLLDRGTYRPIARAALADRVPRQILDQRPRGYQGADWFARLRLADMNAVLEEISQSSAGDLLDLPAIKRAIASWPDLDARNSTHVAGIGRSLTDALAAGLFIAEVERDPGSIGRAAAPVRPLRMDG